VSRFSQNKSVSFYINPIRNSHLPIVRSIPLPPIIRVTDIFFDRVRRARQRLSIGQKIHRRAAIQIGHGEGGAARDSLYVFMAEHVLELKGRSPATTNVY